jgi:hypothetical protein
MRIGVSYNLLFNENVIYYIMSCSLSHEISEIRNKIYYARYAHIQHKLQNAKIQILVLRQSVEMSEMY